MANGLPGRPKNERPSVRLRFGDGNVVLGRDPQMDQLYQRIKELPRGMKFQTVATWLITGAMMETTLPTSQVEAIRQAAEQIVANFVFDEA
jgi:hypothetical protein